MKKFNSINETGWNINNSYIHLPENFYSIIQLSPVSLPQLVVLNEPLAKILGFNIEKIKSKESIEIFAGNRIPEGGIAIAQAYAGHQFGYFTMLGDGRALLLGEHITPNGKRFDIQLKGSGRTPYSRGGDGRAALGPMLREYIISEAMYGLKIPTTRSLAVVTTGESIIRESILKGAVLTRIASSHIRVGTFQYAKRFGTKDDLIALADYTLKRHFPNFESSDNRYLYLLKEVIKKQAQLISKWMLVGFIHGVMNTDNMTISGETIDYGPCAFMDYYDPSTVFSSIDIYGRYAYSNQPNIAAWNLARFAETLLPLLSENKDKAVKIAQNEIEKFHELYKDNWLNGMRAKIGLFSKEKEDEILINNLLNLMYKYKADYTNTFVELTFDKLNDNKLFNSDEFKNWYKLWKRRLNKQNESKEKVNNLMKNNNPAIIPRNHRVEEALEKAVKYEDYSVMKKLLDVLKNPYEHSDEQCEYAKLPPPSNKPYKTFCGT